MLFATTNHIDRLDPALSRPGRMDVWINFKNATRWQAEGIYKRFYPCKTPPSDPAEETTDPSANGPTYTPKRKKGVSTIPVLEEEELHKLAKEFASNIPEDEVSVAALQGYLLKNKARPRECVTEVAEWIVQERKTKEKIKKEKEEVSLGVPDRCMLRLTGPIQRELKEKEEREKREKEKKKEEEKKAEEAAAEAAAEARRALRKARRVAAAAVVSATPALATEALPTPPEETAATEESAKSAPESESSSTETTTDDTDSDSDEAEVATIKEPATKDKKEKWVSVKQPAANDSTTEEKSVTAEQPALTGEKEAEAEAEAEDTSAIDALVDAATTKSAAETASA